MSLAVLCVASATLANPSSASAQFFEGSGVLRLTTIGEPCLVFFPDSGEFSLGLGILADDWGGFDQVGDRIHVAGVLLPGCGGFCTFEGLCFEPDDIVIVAWPIIPAVSFFGLLVIAASMIAAGAWIMKRRALAEGE
jgi:hypothetical protein